MFLVGCKTIGLELVNTECKEAVVEFSLDIVIKEEAVLKHAFLNTHAITKKYFTIVAKPSGKIITTGKPLVKGRYSILFDVESDKLDVDAVLKVVFSTKKGDRTIRCKV